MTLSAKPAINLSGQQADRSVQTKGPSGLLFSHIGLEDLDKATQNFLVWSKGLFSGSHISQIPLWRQKQWSDSHSAESQSGLAAVAVG